MTSRDRLFSKLTNLVSKPRYEKTRVDELVEDVITYFPSRSVTTPLEVSFSKTVTPGSGTPSISTTVPEIKWPCAFITTMPIKFIIKIKATFINFIF